MPLSSKRSDTFMSLLQDLKEVLGGNYTFYEECVVAIARATVYQQDASAWYEQMERVVKGVEVAETSHAGVIFLLREMERGAVTPKREMPPPPLPHRLQQPPTMDQQRSPTLQDFTNFTPSPAAPSPALSAFAFDAPPAPSPSAPAPKAPKHQPPRKEAAVSPFKSPHHHPIFFTDPLLEADIASFFGTNTTTPTMTGYDMGVQHPFNYEASYNFPDDFVRYDPAADDFGMFTDYVKWEEQRAVEAEKRDMAEREKVMIEKGRDEVDVLKEPITSIPHKNAKGRKGGKRR